MSVGVIITGVLYLVFGWLWLDPVMSLIIAGVIVIGTWALFKQSLHLTLDGVPDSVNLVTVRQYLLDLPTVNTVHDLHIWALSSSEIALTVQLVMDVLPTDDIFLQQVNDKLKHDFNINHATIQIVRQPLKAACY